MRSTSATLETEGVGKIRLIQADITQVDADAIVTAANEALCGGGGVDGAVHHAAGPELLAECQRIGGCPVGEARITRGYELLATHVIHAVGPAYVEGDAQEAALLRSAYLSCLRIAEEHCLDHIVFPCISAGVLGFPVEEAAVIAISTVRDWLSTHDVPRIVTFCVYSDDDEEVYRQLLAS